jgi:hypothetical protein
LRQRPVEIGAVAHDPGEAIALAVEGWKLIAIGAESAPIDQKARA